MSCLATSLRADDSVLSLELVFPLRILPLMVIMTEPQTPRRQTERHQAVLLLKQARQLLVDRLAEAVLELGDELLDDARGDSYAGEIDSLHERMGTRLSQVNVLLAGLSESADTDEVEISCSPPNREVAESWSFKTTDQEVVSSATTREFRTGAEAEPSVARPTTSTPQSPAARLASSTSTYPLFVQDIVRRDLPAAGHRLADVLGMTDQKGEVCATRFRDQLDRDPGFLAKVHSLRKCLQTDRLEQARQLLWECFGLQGGEAQAAIQSLKGWL